MYCSFYSYPSIKKSPLTPWLLPWFQWFVKTVMHSLWNFIACEINFYSSRKSRSATGHNQYSMQILRLLRGRIGVFIHFIFKEQNTKMKKMEKIQLQQQNPQEKTIDQFHQQVHWSSNSRSILCNMSDVQNESPINNTPLLGMISCSKAVIEGVTLHFGH